MPLSDLLSSLPFLLHVVAPNLTYYPPPLYSNLLLPLSDQDFNFSSRLHVGGWCILYSIAVAPATDNPCAGATPHLSGEGGTSYTSPAPTLSYYTPPYTLLLFPHSHTHISLPITESSAILLAVGQRQEEGGRCVLIRSRMNRLVRGKRKVVGVS